MGSASRLRVSESVRLLASLSGPELDALIEQSASDTRPGVIEARARAVRRIRRELAEEARLESLMGLQCGLHSQGFAVVAGVDEVGRGALAGPVTAAAVILDPKTRIHGLDDSKRLSGAKREVLAARVREACVCHSVAHVPAHIIDAIGIAPATKAAVEIALQRLSEHPSHVLTDGHPFGLRYPETGIVKGDSKAACIAAASIVAKVERDKLMIEFATHFGRWGFEIHKGYGTPEHLEAIATSGLSPVHRRSFAPCADEPTLF